MNKRQWMRHWGICPTCLDSQLPPISAFMHGRLLIDDYIISCCVQFKENQKAKKQEKMKNWKIVPFDVEKLITGVENLNPDQVIKILEPFKKMSMSSTTREKLLSAISAAYVNRNKSRFEQLEQWALRHHRICGEGGSFWQCISCRNPGLALPLIALQYHNVTVNLIFKKTVDEIVDNIWAQKNKLQQ